MNVLACFENVGWFERPAASSSKHCLLSLLLIKPSRTKNCQLFILIWYNILKSVSLHYDLIHWWYSSSLRHAIIWLPRRDACNLIHVNECAFCTCMLTPENQGEFSGTNERIRFQESQPTEAVTFKSFYFCLRGFQMLRCWWTKHDLHYVHYIRTHVCN